MHFVAAESEAGMDRLNGSDAIGFCHHATGTDFAGGDQFDIEAGIGQIAEHPASCPGCGRHACSNGTNAGDGGAILKLGTRPLGKQRCERLIGARALVPLEGEGDVAAAVGMLPFRLHDRVQTDARISEGGAEGCCSARLVGHMAHTHLGLIAIEGNAYLLYTSDAADE